MADDRIHLPPCPTCGQPADDIRQLDELTLAVERLSYMPLRIDTARRHMELLPCKCPIREYELRTIQGETRLAKIVMASGWKWELGWESQELQPPGLTPGQTPGYDGPHAIDQDQDRTPGGSDPGRDRANRPGP